MELIDFLRNLFARPGVDAGPEAPPPLPTGVILEVTNACNLRCRLCHFHGEGAARRRAIGMMDESVWRPAIEELGAWGTPVSLSASGAGEPLLHGRIWDIATLAKSKPNISFGFFCNAMRTDEAAIERILEISIDWITFSVDGCDKKIFEHYRRNAELDVVERNIRALHVERERRGLAFPRISLNMVEYPELKDHVPAFLEHWKDVADEITVARCRPIGQRTFLTKALKRYPCHLLKSMMVMAYDGRVALCCEDIHCDVELGRFPGESLVTIWRGESLARARRAEAEGNWAVVPICRDCHVWSTDRPIRRVENGYEVLEGTAMTTYRPLESLRDETR